MNAPEKLSQLATVLNTQTDDTEARAKAAHAGCHAALTQFADAMPSLDPILVARIVLGSSATVVSQRLGTTATAHLLRQLAISIGDGADTRSLD